MRTSLAMTLFFIASAMAYPATIHIPGDYSTIQEGIHNAMNGDTVLVEPGTYIENIDFCGKAITVRSSDGPHLTIIDGNQSGVVAKFKNYEALDSVLEGFTITNGTGDSGIKCVNASPTIFGNIIIGNSTSLTGGGIYCHYAAPFIMNNLITGNTANLYGGGIGCTLSSPTIVNNVITENTVLSYYGGGICCSNHCYLIIKNNSIMRNSSLSHGGGLFVRRSTAVLCNNIIAKNTTLEHGGGIYCVLNDASLALTNNVFFENTAQWKGGGLYCCQSSIQTITNTIIWRNTATVDPQISAEPGCPLTVTYCNVQGGWPGTGNIDGDPDFVDEVHDDFHILYSSPCRDGGTNSAPNLPEEDFEGDPREANSIVDIGADEFYRHLYYTGNAGPGSLVEIKFVGTPGTSPVGLFIGSGVLDPPLPTIWGDWYLAFPIFDPILLAPISSLGVEILSVNLPSGIPGPYSIPMQALIGNNVTNLCLLNVTE